MKSIIYEFHANTSTPQPILPQLPGLRNIRDVWEYINADGDKQFWVIDRPQQIFIVNHFCWTTGVADWIEEKRIKEGQPPTPKKYHQNVAIGFETRAEAKKFVEKEFKNN